MDIFSVFTLCGGLALFLYGMHVMSSGLEKLAGGKLESTLKRMTSTPLRSLLIGAGITIAVQSSSAMTVMLVGFVNSGIMKFGQTIGIIMGSNIGTTLTAWIISAAGIESDNPFLQILKPTSFSPVVALIGILLMMGSKKDRKKNIGSILLGFAILMYGMSFMSDAMAPLGESAAFASLLTMFNNPILGVLVGALFTGIIQSSAASVAILQAISHTGSLTFSMAIPIIMGQNIGTCATALISSIGTSRNAKRVAVVHVIIKLLGTVICLCIFAVLKWFVNWALLETQIDYLGIAICHSIFNILTTAVLLPFSKQLANLTVRLMPDKPDPLETQVFIDERLLRSPAFAVAECKNRTVDMCRLAQKTLLEAISLLDNYNETKAAEIVANEDVLDRYEDKLGTFLVSLSKQELSDSQSEEISTLLHAIGDFERIGDHSVNILDTAKEMRDKSVHFSARANSELDVITRALVEILNTTANAFITGSAKLAQQVEPLEEVIDLLRIELKDRHVERLLKGECTIELGFILSDLLANYERVSDHCSNIAVYTIQMHSSSFDTHAYLNSVKSGEKSFLQMFNDYKEEYKLPVQTAAAHQQQTPQ